MPIRTLFCILFGLLLPGLSGAAFITDDIELQVYSQPFNQGAMLTTIKSGDKVEVLSSDGDFARITTGNNVTGWIEARYLSDEINTRTQLQTLQRRAQDLEAELNATKDKLAKVQTSSISDAELKKLQQSAKDAGWMRAELKKARDSIKQLEDAAKTRKAATTDTQKELEELRTQNAALEQRLAAVLLVNGEQEGLQAAEITEAPTTENVDPAGMESSADSATSESSLAIQLEWFLGSIVTAIIIGIILGMVWLDKRMRKRHGGFRLY